jgi:hypothetical protein
MSLVYGSKVESISLYINEICEFRHDERRGVTLEFKTKNVEFT